MSNLVKISIIVPVYKVEHSIHRCIDSILAQSFKDFELILVDDGSPDNSGAICNDYATKDKRVRVIHKKNGGVSSARNAGLDIATGEYITFVDSDDYIAIDYLQQMQSDGSDLIISGVDTLNHEGNLLYTHKFHSEYFTSKENIILPLLYKQLMLYSPYSKLFRRNLIQELNLRFPIGVTWGEDGMFVSDYLQAVSTLRVLDYVGYFYIKYPGDNTLSTKIRNDIIDTISYSREYCIQNAYRYFPNQGNQVSIICTEDIRKNCAYFVKELIHSSNPWCHSNKQILQTFLKNHYVRETILDSHKYYGDDISLILALKQKSAFAILLTYNIFTRLLHIKQTFFRR